MSLFPKFNLENTTPATVATTATIQDKSRKSRESRNEANLAELHGIPLAELQKAAGDDWPAIKDNSEDLKALAQAITTRRMRESGNVPAHYTTTTDCKGCGLVWIFEGGLPKVKGCPWCFNRLQNLPTPKPEKPLHRAPVTIKQGETVYGVQTMVYEDRSAENYRECGMVHCPECIYYKGVDRLCRKRLATTSKILWRRCEDYQGRGA